MGDSVSFVADRRASAIYVDFRAGYLPEYGRNGDAMDIKAISLAPARRRQGHS